MAVVPFCTSAFVDGQPWSTCSGRRSRCSVSRVAILISSAVKLSGMSMHDSFVIMVMHMPGILSQASNIFLKRLLRLAGSRQILSFTYPCLSIFSRMTKVLIQE